MNLEKLGWNSYFEKEFQPYSAKVFYPARVITQHKGIYTLCSDRGFCKARISGKFMHNADINKDYPSVGDWVVIKMADASEAVIHAVLPRKSYFARKLAISGGRKIKNGMVVGGYIEEQIIGANIDTVFIVSGLDDNFNIRRLERYITLALSSGAEPVILLNKCDLCSSTADYTAEINKIAENIAVYAISVLKAINMDIFNRYLCCGKTVVFLGSSGVGKSTIINYLFGDEIQRTNTISGANGKGRHTTTSAQLLQHESGCMLIDTPGIRELQLWADEDILSESFQDISSLAEKCRFRDCRHDKEAGCAIKAAIEEGSLSLERFNSYKSQQKELKVLKDKRKSYDNNRTKKSGKK
jgi:ribosome biogenesis GTPase / thiamine phosphate phosphatase